MRPYYAHVICLPQQGSTPGLTLGRVKCIIWRKAGNFPLGWGNFARQSPLFRFFSAKNIPVISHGCCPWFNKYCKCPYPNSLILKQSLEFPLRGKETIPSPVFPDIQPRLTQESTSWGKLVNICILFIHIIIWVQVDRFSLFANALLGPLSLSCLWNSSRGHI